MHSSDVTAVFQLPGEAATLAVGESLATAICPGMVVFLEGDLGSGKTTLARALIRALGHAGPVKSPTYSLVEVYVVSSLYLYHFDFYRFESPEEFFDAGLDEHFNAASVCLVEWPERAADCVPRPDLSLRFEFAREGRRLEVIAGSEKGGVCLSKLIQTGGAANFSVMPARR